MNRILAIATACLFSTPALAETLISVAKSPTCGCCNAWIEHLEENGFAVEAHDLTSPALHQFKLNNGIAPEHMSCHTAIVEGYTIEGHVPAEDIRKLLADRPEATGLAVPGMPIGSPGMEMGAERDAYDVLLVSEDGGADVYSSYEAQ